MHAFNIITYALSALALFADFTLAGDAPPPKPKCNKHVVNEDYYVTARDRIDKKKCYPISVCPNWSTIESYEDAKIQVCRHSTAPVTGPFYLNGYTIYNKCQTIAEKCTNAGGYVGGHIGGNTLKGANCASSLNGFTNCSPGCNGSVNPKWKLRIHKAGS